MKILYIITKSNWGGAQKYVFDLAKNMKSEEREVKVAFGGNGLLSQKLNDEKIETIHIKNLDRDVNILKEFSVASELYSVLKKENPDIVHLNSSKIGALGSLVARLAGIKKIIFTAHGFPFREERPFLQIILIKFISWLSIIFSHKTICVSKKDYEDVKDWLFVKDKIITIHNGIEVNESVKENNKDVEEIKIVSIGELNKNKGFEYALQAVNFLKEKVKNFKYTILSFGGDERESLEKQISELSLEKYVELIITEEKSDKLLKNFDIYFMPSIKEGLPYVLLEAGMNSLPIVASDTGGISEIVEDYKTGFLIKPKDVQGFRSALEKLIESRELRERFGKEARKKIEENFSLSKMAKETEKVYFS